MHLTFRRPWTLDMQWANPIAVAKGLCIMSWKLTLTKCAVAWAQVRQLQAVRMVLEARRPSRGFWLGSGSVPASCKNPDIYGLETAITAWLLCVKVPLQLVLPGFAQFFRLEHLQALISCKDSGAVLIRSGVPPQGRFPTPRWLFCPALCPPLIYPVPPLNQSLYPLQTY